MFRNLKIGTKITLLVIIVVLISVLSISYLAFNLTKSSVEQQYREAITIVAQLKEQKMNAFFDQIKSNLKFGSQLKAVKDKLKREYNLAVPAIASKEEKDSTGKEDTKKKEETKKEETKKEDTVKTVEPEFQVASVDENLEEVLDDVQKTYKVNHIYLTDRDGKLVYTVGKGNTSQRVGTFFKDIDGNTIGVGRDSVYYSNLFKVNRDFYFYASTSVLDYNTGKSLGVLIYEINMEQVYDLTKDTVGLGKTDEIVLVKARANKIEYLNPLRGDKEAPLKRSVGIDDKKISFIHKAVKGREGSSFDIDYRGQEVLAAWRYIKAADWGLIVKIDASEIYEPTYRLAYIFGISSALVIIISLIIGVIFSRLLINPIFSLQETISLLSKGILPNRIEQKGEDEIGEMTDQLNELVTNLRNTADFALQIGQGDFDTDFNPVSENDTLGLALLTMRDSIQEATAQDEERNWIVTGRAEIGDILRETTDIEVLGEKVIEYICRKVNAVQGAFYTLNSIDEQDTDDLLIEMNASYAYNKRKYLKAKFHFAEGLVGQAVAEQDIIHRTEIPDDYVTITSGLLGDQRPKALLISPLKTTVDRQDKVLGVLEFAGFKKFDTREVKFVTEVSEIIARTVFNIKVSENTKRLLEVSQNMSSDLQMQREVLQQNAEVMEATQEELKETNKKLQFQVEEVRRANDKTQLLLQNASEVITIYREDGIISYISPSVEKILGYTEAEMVGVNDTDFINSDGDREIFEKMFVDLINNPYEKITINFSYLTKTGETIWLEATGTNFLTDEAIQGIVINKRDITERRRAEAEQRMRGQMQALSENSPDLITRFSEDRTVFYINPVIEQYTGHSKENYLRKHLDELSLNDKVLNQWSAILNDVVNNDKKVSTEMSFPSQQLGERIMQLDAIPEYNEENRIESVLMVSHDVTERKMIELDIALKNKRIQESINYAKRIQEAILPDTADLQKYFSDSFILYKPRDVVSGDFPWFFQKDDDVYIAAVDCTGHGVPGAFISLIGYFLLNNIIGTKNVREPGIVLDMLDQSIESTLKQNINGNIPGSTKDGMDISLCKINTKENTLEYAGAHRPLYYTTKDGEFKEIKGDKFPIGGGQYKNKSNFANTVVHLQKNDTFYLFSDGYPDQFGGEFHKKITPKKIRDIIISNHNSNMSDICDILDDEFENWKGKSKQTDDVLIIGLKY